MRILAGQLKNRSIEMPKKAKTRPTSSKIRAQLFNICQHIIEGAHFLDLFAGSGAVGLEAISRGALCATFIDHDRDAIESIKRSAKSLRVEAQCRFMLTDAVVSLQRLEREIQQGKRASFDVIFIDPPYYQKEDPKSFSLVQEVILYCDTSQYLISPGGWVFVEDSRFSPIETISPSSLQFLSKRQTGDSCLYEFRKKVDIEAL